ncbi:hypothetical protein Rt10032_c21g6460 [Rhodotorula toruloides]|uniref:Uncharacterized protein n=1 Tax=Rhodotorula toruloides TaxID=5286 RepID=A0A511KQ12_RHOTO|nr:hypothetical protein Rt10032_c21g6460 [Rhodotorula toruloides]
MFSTAGLKNAQIKIADSARKLGLTPLSSKGNSLDVIKNFDWSSSAGQFGFKILEDGKYRITLRVASPTAAPWTFETSEGDEFDVTGWIGLKENGGSASPESSSAIASISVSLNVFWRFLLPIHLHTSTSVTTT